MKSFDPMACTKGRTDDKGNAPPRSGDGEVAEWFKAAVLKATGAGDLCAKNGVWLQGVSVSPIRRVVSPISLS